MQCMFVSAISRKMLAGTPEMGPYRSGIWNEPERKVTQNKTSHISHRVYSDTETQKDVALCICIGMSLFLACSFS